MLGCPSRPLVTEDDDRFQKSNIYVSYQESQPVAIQIEVGAKSLSHLAMCGPSC